MFNFVKQILDQYDVVKKDNIQTVLQRLGITSGYDNTQYEYGNQRDINTFYDNIVWVYRSVDFVASNLAQLPWKVVKVKNDSSFIDYTDRLNFQIFKDPNPWQTAYDFKMESFARLQLQGELFWEIQRANSGQIVALWPDWRSDEVKIIGDAKRRITGYERTIDDKVYKYGVDEVFYVRRMNPNSNLRGLSPMQPGRHTSENELNATFFNKQFFKQGARPSAILSTDQKLTESEQDRLERLIQNKYTSVDEMHKISVLWGGIKWLPLNSMSMTDMQFKDLKSMNRQEIVSTYGLSLEVLGIGEKTYENVRYYRRMAWTETLMPLNEKVLGFINKYLLPDILNRYDLPANVKIIADYSKVEALKEDREKKRKDYVEGFKVGSLTRNEVRVDVFGKQPINKPGMDEPVFDYSGAGQGAGGGGSSEGEERDEPEI